jgi:hypothetical protein
LTAEHDFIISKMNVHEAMARKYKDRYWKSCLINCNPPYSQAERKLLTFIVQRLVPFQLFIDGAR